MVSVGGGNIGLQVAKMFHGAFRGSIMIYDPYLRSLDQWHAEVSPCVTLVQNLDELLLSSDIVTIHVPLTPATENMIAQREFRLMKNSCILVNTARGGIINEADLVDALEQGEIYAAGLDAVVSEPPSLSKHKALCASDRVVLLYVSF
jgi:phosphoglycerate dehydrogenase-like enzyme